MAKQKPNVTIDGKNYTEDQLTDEQKALVNHMLNLEQKIANQVFQLEQLQGGMEFFIGKLKSSLEAVK